MHSSVAVVILNWNGKNHLETFLPSVVRYSQSASIYVADNASTDDSVAFLKENYPTINLIQNSENGGFALGYNQALKDLKEDYFVLLNSDVEVTENWIEPVIEKMEQSENIVIAQPKIKAYLQKDTFEYAGAAGGFIDYLGYPFCRGRIFSELEKDQGQYDNDCEIFWATGACMFIKNEVFKHLGGFDANYFAHMEEIDLCWRAKNQGYKVFYIGSSTVFHLGGGTMQNSNPFKTFLNFRNSLLTIYKNDQSPFRILKIAFRLILDGLAFLKVWSDSGAKHAFSILKAHFSFYTQKKKKIKAKQINSKGIYQGSIVLDFYWNKKTTFNQLKKGVN